MTTPLTELITPPPAGRKRLWRRALLIIPLLILGLGAFWLLSDEEKANHNYRTAEIVRSDLSAVVNATGTLQARTKVDISSELSGTLAEVLVDYNSKVSKGQALAILNTTKLGAQRKQNAANLAAANARITQAQADVDTARSSLERLEKLAQLSSGQLPAQAELSDARGKLRNMEAVLEANKASSAQIQAALHINETDLTKATIRSPINGTVLTRSADPGQTVAASLQAPILFTIAQDLTDMDLNIAVAESDVGLLKEGMAATFSVDAWPGKRYQAKVRQIRYAAKTVDNVVSYETILQVNNNDLSLRPGMTASAELQIAEHKNVLIVPNAALRFTPPSTAQSSSQNNILSKIFPPPPNLRGNRPKEVTQVGRRPNGSEGRIWLLDANNQPKAQAVTLGLSDGKRTEISSSEIREGQLVITRFEQNKSDK